MLKENNKGKSEDREQGELEKKGYQTPHRKAGLIVKARRKDEREGIV